MTNIYGCILVLLMVLLKFNVHNSHVRCPHPFSTNNVGLLVYPYYTLIPALACFPPNVNEYYSGIYFTYALSISSTHFH